MAAAKDDEAIRNAAASVAVGASQSRKTRSGRGPRRCVLLPPGLLPLHPSYSFFGYSRQSHCGVEAFEGSNQATGNLPPISTGSLADLIGQCADAILRRRTSSHRRPGNGKKPTSVSIKPTSAPSFGESHRVSSWIRFRNT